MAHESDGQGHSHDDDQDDHELAALAAFQEAFVQLCLHCDDGAHVLAELAKLSTVPSISAYIATLDIAQLDVAIILVRKWSGPCTDGCEGPQR